MTGETRRLLFRAAFPLDREQHLSVFQLAANMGTLSRDLNYQTAGFYSVKLREERMKSIASLASARSKASAGQKFTYLADRTTASATGTLAHSEKTLRNVGELIGSPRRALPSSR